MKLTLKSPCLTVKVETLGGELQSIRDADNTEYLWQGDPAYWSGRAINLFPWVGRLTEGKYRHRGREYAMGNHGFWRRRNMAVAAQSGDACTLLLKDDADTRAQYPFPFALRLHYRLAGCKLHVTFEVENTGEETMYFGIGGHPGFNVPLEAGLTFEDYALVFDRPARPKRMGLSPACFLQGEDLPYPLVNDRTLPLTHSLFDDDAIVLQGMDTTVQLQSAKGQKAVRVEYPHLPYLGFWHKPQTDAPYICIEPWSSLPARQDVVEELAEKPDLVRLPAGERWQNEWSIECLF